VCRLAQLSPREGAPFQSLILRQVKGGRPKSSAFPPRGRVWGAAARSQARAREREGVGASTRQCCRHGPGQKAAHSRRERRARRPRIPAAREGVGGGGPQPSAREARESASRCCRHGLLLPVVRINTIHHFHSSWQSISQSTTLRRKSQREADWEMAGDAVSPTFCVGEDASSGTQYISQCLPNFTLSSIIFLLPLL